MGSFRHSGSGYNFASDVPDRVCGVYTGWLGLSQRVFILFWHDVNANIYSLPYCVVDRTDRYTELLNLAAVQQEALLSSADMIKGQLGAGFWRGEAWRLWVTDKANGGGNTVLLWTSPVD